MELRSSRVLKNVDLSIDNDDSVDEKGGNEGEIRVCVDNEGLESGTKDVITDDKGLFVGSEVLDPVKDLIVSCPEGEIEEESVERIRVECSKRNRLVPDFKDEIESSENVESGKSEEDDADKTVNSRLRRVTKRKSSGKLKKADGECSRTVSKRKRGRKRKGVEGSGCNGVTGAKKGVIPASGRVLRSRSVSGGLKRKTRTDLEVDSGRPKKKSKRRGRPPKLQTDNSPESSHRKVKRRGRGRPRKDSSEYLPENGQPGNIPAKKLRGRGRPRKDKSSHETRGRPRKDAMFLKLKRRGRGRPPKTPAMTIANHVIKMRTVKLFPVKKSDNETGRKLPKLRKRAPEVEVAGDDQAPAEVTGDPPEKKKSGGCMGERRREQQLVRDRILGILLSAGWTVDRRSRPDRAYKDAVYIDPKGRGHWSITKAYSMLKRKIEKGDADSNEVSAFVSLPDDEVSVLFRFNTKVRSDKKTERIAGTGKRKPTKKKTIRNSVNRSSNVKRKRDKSHQERPKLSRKPCLLARTSEKGSDQDNDGCSLYNRKCNLLAWMIDSGVVLPGSKVQYGKTRRQKRSFEGTVSVDGIQCGCCNEVLGVSEFAAHAGGKLRQPFDNVFLESGTSFRQCLAESWRKEEASNSIGFNLVDVKGDDPNDDTCNICGDGGNLICCDSCPSTFHQSCLDIQNFPSGDWNCIYCSCKFCHKALTSEMLVCCLCEEKFHESCFQEVEAGTIGCGKQTFCGSKCEELFGQLETYLGVKRELEDGFSWTLLQRSNVGQDFSLPDAETKVERNSKLAVAFSVMDECFVPIVDERSGTNIIHNVVYNCSSNIRRLNFAGFFTVILEKGDELVSAASIRIHGHRLAEMPFIGTRHMYRRQGMCRRLLDAIESTLSSLGVEELVIPAIPELLQTWTKVFGFMSVEESTREAMKSMSMIVFPRIDMLQKPLFRSQSAASEDKSAECIPEANEKHIESSNSLDCKQTPEDSTVIVKDAVNHEQTEDADADANGVCDLNFPAEDVTCPVPVPVPDTECPAQHDVSMADFVKNEPELELGVENDAIPEAVKASPKVVPKITFDLNLHPAAVDPDMHIVDDASLPLIEPRGCTKSFEIADPTSQLENGDGQPSTACPALTR